MSARARLAAINKDLEDLRYFNEIIKPKLNDHQLRFLYALNSSVGMRKVRAWDGVARDKNELEALREELEVASSILVAAIPNPEFLTNRIGTTLDLPM